MKKMEEPQNMESLSPMEVNDTSGALASTVHNVPGIKPFMHLSKGDIKDDDEDERERKEEMTEGEFYAKLDHSLESTDKGPIYTMRSDETGEDFIKRLISEAE